MCDFASDIVIISGPSGAGKDTIANKLITMDDSLSLSVSATTRLPRKGEVEGINYYFFSEKEFEKMVSDDAFVEYAKYGSGYYGTLKSDVSRRISSGKTVILVIDVNGADNIRKKYPGVLSVFIMPPSESELAKRLKRRMTDSEKDILTRMNIAKKEILKSCEYNYTVVNDSLDEAVNEVYNIISAHRKKG